MLLTDEEDAVLRPWTASHRGSKELLHRAGGSVVDYQKSIQIQRIFGLMIFFGEHLPALSSS
jgi:hypothetical protein